MNKVSLEVNGKIFEGWKDVQIRSTIKACSGAFSLSITDRWSGQHEPWIVSPGDKCVLKIGKETVLTGYVDSVSPSFDATSRTIEVAGRDVTSDFVDCSVDISQFEFNDISLEEFVSRIVKSFNIPVVFRGTSSGKITRISISPGETGFEVVEKYARQKGFLVTTDGKGTLIITRPGTTRANTAIVQGKNILSASAQYDSTERYSQYKVISQFGDLAQELGTGAYSIMGSASDRSITRQRKLIVSAENSMTENDAALRAQWEATVRAARSSKFRVTLQGWTQEDGSLWRANQLVRAKAPWIGLDGDMLIVGVSFSMSADSGSITVLELERKDAYNPVPELQDANDPLAQQVKKALAK